MCRWSLAATLLLGGCAAVGSAPIDPLHDAAVPLPVVDLAEGIISNIDMAQPPPPGDAGPPLPPDLARPPQPADMVTVACGAAEHVVINEVLVNGTSNTADEFIELYNPCATKPQPIGGWQLLHRSTSGTSDTPTISIPSGKSVPMNGYFLIVGPSYSGSAPYDIKYSSAMLSSTGGGMALKDGSGTLVDSMGWGATATNAYVVGSPAPSPPDGKSIARMPNGSEQHMNDAQDFAVATPTPRAIN